MFDESLETAARNKKRDHEFQAAGKATMMIDYDLGNGTLIKFVTQSQLMPATQGKSRRVVEAERHAQIAQYVNEKPSAMILHIGLHEICGAFGPSWFTHHIHQPCASRKEIAETYEDYGQALFEHGIQHKTFFRSILGSYGDVDPGRYWRWHGFLNEKRSWVTGDARGSGGNPCNSIAGPFAHASFMEGDAPKAWSGSGVGFIDAYSPIHAGKTSDSGMSDGLHTVEASDEALAVNQLIMNALCTMKAD